MIDRKLLNKKILLQRIKNLLSMIHGITVLCIDEQNLLNEHILNKINFYNYRKIPDSKIYYLSFESEIINWIINILNFPNGTICYLWIGDYFVKIQINNVSKAVSDLWNYLNPNSKGFILINKNKNVMYSFGNDSRDEENILFDQYDLSDNIHPSQKNLNSHFIPSPHFSHKSIL